MVFWFAVVKCGSESIDPNSVAHSEGNRPKAELKGGVRHSCVTANGYTTRRASTLDYEAYSKPRDLKNYRRCKTQGRGTLSPAAERFLKMLISTWGSF